MKKRVRSERMQMWSLTPPFSLMKADYDLTGQLVWPGAQLMNDYLCSISSELSSTSVIELGSGVGLTGLLCATWCKKVVMTDHNDIVLKLMRQNVERCQSSAPADLPCPDMRCEKLEWGDEGDLEAISTNHPAGFDFVLGADICYQSANVPLLFDVARKLLSRRPPGKSTFILAHVSVAIICHGG
eukprot:jgi/Mesen1/5642/ME000286S04854